MTEIFLGNEALGEGLSRHELRRWYRPLFRGVYMPTGAKPSLGDRTLGAWLTTNRTGVVAGVAAAACTAPPGSTPMSRSNSFQNTVACRTA